MKKFLLLALPAIALFGFGLFELMKGNWSNGQGQTIRFGKGNECLWIFDLGHKKDTFIIKYHYEKTGKQTAILDLGPFDRGYLKGRSLYGIVEWGEKKNEFKYDAEPGKTAKVRPAAINPAQVQVYKKVK